MLSCFSTLRGRSLRTPGRESVCERLKRRLTPSRCRRPHCSSDTTVSVTDTPGKVSPGVTTSELPKSRCPAEVFLRPNTTGIEAVKSSGQESPRPETPSRSGQVSPELGTENLESQGPGEETEVIDTSPGETHRILVYIDPGLASATGNNITERELCRIPAPLVRAGSRPHSFTKPFLHIFLGSQPVYGPFFPGTSTTHTSTPSVLSLGRDITTASFENSSSFEGFCDKAEDTSIRHGDAGHWRKLHYANGHAFQAKGFPRRAKCAVCTDRVGGLGRQVYKCTRCKLSVHKKCHRLVTVQCGQRSLASEPMVLGAPSTMASHPAQTAIPQNLSSHEGLEQLDEENEAGNTGESGKISPGLSLQDFDLLTVIGRGTYGKVLLVQLKK
ncbi:Protein kinase C iota type [Fukomys damarensis]|uniref:Protein kinase C iota type n=1 Tax=Fukomys damarensis TaxID=885580 RepID=A0A091EMH8_FUKDA|nr:Protein kinase C iota type [Fukomys damarensis]